MKYIQPEIDIIRIKSQSILTDSGMTDTEGGDEDIFGNQ